MPPIFQFAVGARVSIDAQQSTGTVASYYRDYVRGVNRYRIKVDPRQPLVTSNGFYTAFEYELSATSQSD